MKQLFWARRIILFILIAPVAVFIFGGILMLLWNNVLVPVLHVSTITFWQGLGLLILSKILFGNFSSNGARSDYYKQRMMWKNMTPEQKERFKEKWKNRSQRWGYKPADSDTETEQTGTGS